MSRVLFALASLALLLPAAAAPRRETGPRARVLFIGNSYTYFNNLPAVVRALAESRGRRLEARMEVLGGGRLKDHWEKGAALKALRESRWDYVLLQDQSTLGVTFYVDGKTRVDGDGVFRPVAVQWAREIAAAGALPVFFPTWARQASPEDQDRLTRAYMTAARESGARVAPIGPAWQRVRAAHPEIGLFQDDGSHPSPAGSYLSACAIFAALFDEDPAGLPGRIEGPPVNLDTEQVEADKTAVLVDLEPAVTSVLQSAAWSVWRELKESGGYLTLPETDPPAPAALPDGLDLTDLRLEGAWTGELLFHPSGPVRMTLEIRRGTGGRTARLSLDYRPDDLKDESADVEAFEIAGRRMTFAFPKSPAAADLRIDFQGVATGPAELRGIAEAAKESAGGILRLVGSWRMSRE